MGQQKTILLYCKESLEQSSVFLYLKIKKWEGKYQAAREEAFNQAKIRALSIMGDAAKELLREVYGDLNIWLDNKIEYYVGLGKKAA